MAPQCLKFTQIHQLTNVKLLGLKVTSVSSSSPYEPTYLACKNLPKSFLMGPHLNPLKFLEHSNMHRSQLNVFAFIQPHDPPWNRGISSTLTDHTLFQKLLQALFRIRSSLSTLICHCRSVLNTKSSIVAFTHLWEQICIPHLHQILSSKYISCSHHPTSFLYQCQLRKTALNAGVLVDRPSFFLNIFYSLSLNFLLVCMCVCVYEFSGCPRTLSISLILSELALYSLQSFQFKSSQSSWTGPFCTAVYEGFPLDRLQVQDVCCVCTRVCEQQLLALLQRFYCQNSDSCISPSTATLMFSVCHGDVICKRSASVEMMFLILCHFML